MVHINNYSELFAERNRMQKILSDHKKQGRKTFLSLPQETRDEIKQSLIDMRDGAWRSIAPNPTKYERRQAQGWVNQFNTVLEQIEKGKDF